MYLTRKQTTIMQTIVKGNQDGSFVDMDQLLQRINYETSKQSMQFSLRKLVEKGLVEKQPYECRRGHRRVIISATSLGYEVARGTL